MNELEYLYRVIDRACEENPTTFTDSFKSWLAENLHVWHRFQFQCDRLRRNGRKHYSAHTIIGFLRFETTLSDAGIEFKINNNSIGDLSRLYLLTHPEAEGFFETRGREAA